MAQAGRLPLILRLINPAAKSEKAGLAMEINADFEKRALVRSGQLDWAPSPMPGVDRRMLDRMGGEVARATSIVRYAPGSHFSAHTHDGGEEFLVLDGVFQDEHGDYPAGSYIRNPPTSSHTPGAAEGCVIFVKLWQFDSDDRTQVKIDVNKMAAVRDADRDGVSVTPLFADTRENVRIEHWQPNTKIAADMPGGTELLLLEGGITESGEAMAKHDWLRIPAGGKLSAVAGEDGAKLWVKSGHLTGSIPPPSSRE